MFIYNKPEISNKSEFTGYMVDEFADLNSFDYSSIHRSREFNEACNYFDKTDNLTRNVLLAVNEADQNAVMISLSNKLYKHIVDKIDDIDFGTIPESKGDITKIDNYDKLTDCINIISEILVQYHQSPDSVNTIQIALQNMIDRRDMFEKAYKLNIEMPIIIYNTMALSIVSATSYMIASCIEFVKLPGDQGFDIALDKAATLKTRDHILFQDLNKFNKLCATGEFDKAMDFVIKQSASNFTGIPTAGAAVVVTAIGIILLIIPVIRELIFFFYYTRTKISNYFDAQASILLMNSYNIENNLTKDDISKKDIATKQKKIADSFKKISNFFKVEYKSSASNATKEIDKLNKEKLKITDTMDNIPDSASAALF